MDFPSSLKKLFQSLDGFDLFESDGIRRLSGESCGDLDDLLSLTGTSLDQWQAEISLIALWRAFLNILPAAVLENPEERCKGLVQKRLTFLLGEKPDDRDLKVVVKAIKRLQQYQKGGRRSIGSTSFDYESVSQLRLLKKQGQRCNCCGYKFLKNDLIPLSIIDGDPTLDMPITEFDRSPTKIFRKAELDHVLPIYLAGDRETNWQVLCKCCNGGKSDLVIGIEGKGWFGSARLSELISVSPKLFYMILRRDRSCSVCGRNPKQVELRIIRRDENGANFYPNLVSRCVDCLKK